MRAAACKAAVAQPVRADRPRARVGRHHRHPPRQVRGNLAGIQDAGRGAQSAARTLSRLGGQGEPLRGNGGGGRENCPHQYAPLLFALCFDPVLSDTVQLLLLCLQGGRPGPRAGRPLSGPALRGAARDRAHREIAPSSARERLYRRWYADNAERCAARPAHRHHQPQLPDG